MPLEAPVTIATLPSSRPMRVLLLNVPHASPRRAKRSRSSRFKTLPMALRGRAGTISTRGQPLRLADLAVEPIADLLGAACAAGFQHDERHGRLSPSIRGDAHHGRFRDSRVAGEHGLQVARVDVEPAGDDHVLLAIHQHEETIGIEAADVARCG